MKAQPWGWRIGRGAAATEVCNITGDGDILLSATDHQRALEALGVSDLARRGRASQRPDWVLMTAISMKDKWLDEYEDRIGGKLQERPA